MFASIDNLIEEVVSHCLERRPEALDKIFDNLHSSEYQHITLELLEKISISLQNDTESLAWFCGYMASEINCSEDNHQQNYPITELAKILVLSGMEPFIDFTPYPGSRIVIVNTVKFEALPQSVKAVVQKAFDLLERNDLQIEQMNNALLQEFVISKE
ncbi:MAG: hypothetical protein PUP92_17485 [Rhizonema sp. PD38]|nr:hypothetical protein [Rhizonema sp. PD38]